MDRVASQASCVVVHPLQLLYFKLAGRREMKTGWKVIGNDAGRRIAEFRVSDEPEALMRYVDARQIALDQLRNQIAPYLARIKELESDVFEESGALPPLKAWQTEYRSTNYIVAAKSKKRAAELVDESRHWFDSNWSACDGDWWYRLAHEEALWIEKRDEKGLRSVTFHQCLTKDVAAAILEQHATAYRTINPSRLLRLVDEDLIEANVSTAGTPYKITTTVRRYNWGHESLHIECRIDDGCNLVRHPSVYIIHELPQGEVVAGWKTEGF